MIGFFACGAVDMTAQRRVLGQIEFEKPTTARPTAIELKGRMFFVERDYGNRFNLAESLLLPCWLVGAAGIVVGNHRKLIAKLSDLLRRA